MQTGRHTSRSAVLLAAMALAIAVAGSCARSGKTDVKGKLTVITTLFPTYDFARQIAGNTASVRILLPPGIEAHSFEPTPRDIADIRNADIFVYTGKYMEPWVEKIAIESASAGVTIVDASTGIGLLRHDDDGHHGDFDPHIWTDPLNAKIMAENIAEALAIRLPEKREAFLANLATYEAELDRLHELNTEVMKHARVRTIVYAGHFAFGYFAKRYGLDHVSPYEGYSPDAEPNPRRIASLIETIKSLRLSTVFYEEIIAPRVATVIAEQAGIDMVLLHGAHNVTPDEFARGVTYIGIMRENIEKLKAALE